jgi:hypothetical protein
MGNSPYATEKAKTTTNFNACFDFGSKKVTFYRVNKDMDHALDIIPFTITSKLNPYVVSGGMKVGDKLHMLDYFVHRNVGPLKKTIICPLKTSELPCPICEEYERAKAEKGYDSPEAKALKCSRRVAYNFIDADDDDEVVQIFDVSWHMFTKDLIDEATHEAKRLNVEDLDYAGVLNPADAMTIECRNTMEKKGGFDTAIYKGFKFVPRKDKHKGASPVNLDEFMVVKSYKEIESMQYGEEEGAEDVPPPVVEKEERPTRRARDEDEAPRRSRRDEPEEEKGKTCPHGMTLGKDYDTDDKKCDKEDCEAYSECRAEYRAKYRN